MKEDGQIVYRRRRSDVETGAMVATVEGRLQEAGGGPRKGSSLTQEQAMFFQLQEESRALKKEQRECPVPKPKGIIGEMLGFNSSKSDVSASEKR